MNYTHTLFKATDHITLLICCLSLKRCTVCMCEYSTTMCVYIPHSPPSELITSTANRTENLLQILPASECSGMLSGEWLGQRALSYEISFG